VAELIKILITGVSGYLGIKLAQLMLQTPEKYQVFGSYHNFKNFPEKTKTQIIPQRTIQLDVRSRSECLRVITEFKPDWVIHCAAIRELGYCEENPDEAREVNLVGTEHIANACVENNVKLMFISSDIIFDGTEERYTEDNPKSPLNIYGQTKAAAEEAIQHILPQNQWCIVRLSVLFGQHILNRKPDFLEFVLNNLRNNEPVKLFTDKYRNFTHIDWAAGTILDLIAKDQTGIFNVCGDECINNLMLGEMIADHFGLEKDHIIPVKMENIQPGLKQPKRVEMVNSKLISVLGEHARMPQLRDTLELIKKNY
jgi:dTDP-4-dehydrorhamnose reductase